MHCEVLSCVVHAVPHQHRVLRLPANFVATGHAVCECGASIRMVRGNTVGDWHACYLCTNGGDSYA